MAIIFDAMGGDYAPIENIKGAYKFLKESKKQVILVGQKERIDEISLSLYNKKMEDMFPNVKIVHASEVIEMTEKPVEAVKKKRDSSIVVAAHLLKEKNDSVLVSAGSTGAVLTSSFLIVGRPHRVQKPALSGLFTSAAGKFMLLDCGANVKTTSSNMIQYAEMANIYFKFVEGIENPRIALLNNGVEENKGTELHKEVYALLKEESNAGRINFVGNIEARNIFNGEAEIILTDGFSGNVLVKGLEGGFSLIKNILLKNMPKFLTFLLLGKSILKLKDTLDYKKLGGGVLLGVNQPVIKVHGNSDAKSFYYALKQAEMIEESNFTEEISERFGKRAENL